MKIAIVGCGAVGSFYGAKLARAGHTVHFLLRSDFDTVRREGVRILSPQGDFRVEPVCARTPQEIGPADLVIEALKATANHVFPHLLPPLVGPHTSVLTLQNGLGNEEALARLFPPTQILGGLCFVCLNRINPGVVRHMDHGQIVIGEFALAPGKRTHDLAHVFCDAGVPCSVAPNLAEAHWDKLTWNIPFNGLGVAGAAGIEAVLQGELPSADAHATSRFGNCLTTDLLLADPRWTSLVRQLILETVSAARALGFPLSESLVETQIKRTRTMGAYKASTLLDFERGQAIELESLFLEPMRQALRAGACMPGLERLCALLCEMDSIRITN
jgi:2-dehydropantoate 2-reductase